MKKKFWYVALAALCLMGTSTFTSCSDDDDPAPVVCPVGETEFTAAKGLQLMYNGQPMLGQKVKFTPNGDKATLTIQSDFDLSGLIGGKANLPLQLQGPGLLPGTPELTLHVDLKVNGDQCSFEGAGEAEYCTYEYQGTVAKGSLNLQFSNVKLKDTSFEGTWNLTKFAYIPSDWGDSIGEVTASPIHIVWESEKGVSLFPGFDLPVQNILDMALRMPLIPAGENKITAPEMLNTVLKDVTFQKDGNIVATYTDVKNPAAGEQISPQNLAQYVVVDANTIRVFLNPVAILAQVKQRSISIPDEAITAAIEQLLPLLKNGVPVAYRAEGDQRTVFLNKDFLQPLLQSTVAPLFKNEKFVKEMIEAMKKVEGMGELAPMAEPVLKSLPDIIETTTKLEVGLNFTVSK